MRELSTTDSERLSRDTYRMKVREIASVGTAPAENKAFRVGIVTKSCSLRRQPVKDGTQAYLHKNCVHFKEN